MTDFFKRVQRLTTIQSLLLLYGCFLYAFLHFKSRCCYDFAYCAECAFGILVISYESRIRRSVLSDRHQRVFSAEQDSYFQCFVFSVLYSVVRRNARVDCACYDCEAVFVYEFFKFYMCFFYSHIFYDPRIFSASRSTPFKR